MSDATQGDEAKVESGEDRQTYEELVHRLEEVVKSLEGGEMPLDRSLELFEEGIRLSRQASTRLQKAERRLEELLADGSTKPLEFSEK